MLQVTDNATTHAWTDITHTWERPYSITVDLTASIYSRRTKANASEADNLQILQFDLYTLSLAQERTHDPPAPEREEEPVTKPSQTRSSNTISKSLSPSNLSNVHRHEHPALTERVLLPRPRIEHHQLKANPAQILREVLGSLRVRRAIHADDKLVAVEAVCTRQLEESSKSAT